jgi:hypothetical protein
MADGTSPPNPLSEAPHPPAPSLRHLIPQPLLLKEKGSNFLLPASGGGKKEEGRRRKEDIRSIHSAGFLTIIRRYHADTLFLLILSIAGLISVASDPAWDDHSNDYFTAKFIVTATNGPIRASGTNIGGI